MKVTNAIAQILKKEGVEWLIGYPVNPIIEGAAEADIRTIMVRQERIGLHMCDAIAKVTSGDKIGVFVMQHGPGTENAFGGVAQSYGDSCPVVVLPAGYARNINQVHPNFNAALNFRHVTKLSSRSRSPTRRSRRCAAPSRTVKNGRPGPVLVEFPTDILREEIPDALVDRVQEDAAPQERPGSAIGVGDRRGAGRGTAAGHRRRPGRALRQGLAAVEGAGRTARSAGHDDPAGQERLSRKPSAVARLGRHRHRRASLALPAERRFHLRHRLQLHALQLRARRCRRARRSPMRRSIPTRSTRTCRSSWPRSAMPG